MVSEEGQCRPFNSLLLLEPDICNPDEEGGAVCAMSSLFLMLLTKVYYLVVALVQLKLHAGIFFS